MSLLIIRSGIVVLLLAVSILGQDLSQVGTQPFRLEFSGGGARAEGMGNAFLAVSNDVTAGSWNPAGLSGLEKPIISLSWGSLKPRGESFVSIIGIGDGFLEHSGSFSGMSAINFVAPLRVKGHQFVGSVSFTRHSDEFLPLLTPQTFVDFRRTEVEEHYFRIDTVVFDGWVEEELFGGLESISFGAGTRVYGNITAGLNLNIYSGTMAVKSFVELQSDSVVNPYNGQITREAVTVSILDSTKFSGFNFTLGAKYSGDKFDFGGIIRTPFSLNAKTGRSIFQIRTINELPVEQGTDTTYYGDNLAKYDIPWIVAVGLAYHPIEKLTLAADGELRSFGNSKIDSRTSLFLDPGGENIEYFDEIDPDWQNVFHFRLGAEYMMESSIGQIPLRAGYGYLPLILTTYSADGSKSKTVRNTMSLGSGIWWEQIHLDAAYTYSFFDIGGSIKNKDHHLSLMFTGYF